MDTFMLPATNGFPWTDGYQSILQWAKRKKCMFDGVVAAFLADGSCYLVEANALALTRAFGRARALADPGACTIPLVDFPIAELADLEVSGCSALRIWWRLRKYS